MIIPHLYCSGQHSVTHSGADSKRCNIPVSWHRGHRQVEQEAAVRSNVDVSPQPDVVQLPLSQAEPCGTELAEFLSSCYLQCRTCTRRAMSEPHE